jgi:hypothetical protein
LSLALAVAAACGKGTHTTTRTVTMHVPNACPVDGSAYVELTALGDLEPRPAAKGHFLSDVGGSLPEVDTAARALVAVASENGRTWMGAASIPPAGDVDLLLLPSLASCPLSTSVDARAGAALAPMKGGLVLVVGGTGNPTPRTFVADMATGAIDPVRIGLLPQQLARASVTAFGDGALVAGGVADGGTVLATAIAYEPSLNGFDQQRPIQIGDARADQGAVVLATGETLLVGGIGADGKTPLASMEIVDPVTRTVRTEHVAELAVARRAPRAVRLASGEVLVAGGFDGGGNPTGTLEWFAPDGGVSPKRARDLVPSPVLAVASLAGGGALVVLGAPPGAVSGFENVWVINADGAVDAAAPVGSLAAPVLFGGAGGAPVLWTGDRWLRWQPWGGAFGVLAVLDDVPAQISGATCSPDPGLALWMAADTPSLAALRYDVRGAYAPLPHPLFVDDTSETAPDRVPAAGVLSFDPSSGLTLGPGASAFVTDRTYADVAVDLDAPTGEPSFIVLRDELGNELEVGGAACPGVAVAGAMSAHVTRRGSGVTWAIGGGASETCRTGVRGGARLSIGVRGSPSVARSVARNLRIVRL